jgi:hypothetical protein
LYLLWHFQPPSFHFPNSIVLENLSNSYIPNTFTIIFKENYVACLANSLVFVWENNIFSRNCSFQTLLLKMSRQIDYIALQKKKTFINSCIWETLNLLTCANTSNDKIKSIKEKGDK